MGFLSSLGFGGIVNLFMTLWPVVTAAVKVAEAANPQPGAGAQKFNQVLNSVSGVAMALPQVVTAVQATGKQINDAAHSGDVAALTSGIGDVINVAVKLANSVGAFQKSSFVQNVTAAQDAPAILPGHYANQAETQQDSPFPANNSRD